MADVPPKSNAARTPEAVRRGTPWYYLDIGLACLLVVHGILIFPGPLTHYITGWVNSLYLAGTLLIIFTMSAIPVLICSVWLLVRMFVTWPKRVRTPGVVTAGWLGVLLAFAMFFVLPYPGTLRAWGLKRYMHSAADIPAIRTWLATIDPNQLREPQPNGRFAAHPLSDGLPTGVTFPESVSRLRPRYTTLYLDRAGRPTVDLWWGTGVIGSWGLTVGSGDFEVPGAQSTHSQGYSDDATGGMLALSGNYRLPLAPGAYVWSGH
jgi:hypothetical protein